MASPCTASLCNDKSNHSLLNGKSKITGSHCPDHVPQKLCGEFARLEDTPLSDDTGDQFRRRHIERGIVDCDLLGCHGMAAVDGRDF